MTAAVVLAAGAGRRLGGTAKALLERDDGRTFLEAIRDTAQFAGIDHIVVVTGGPHSEVTRAEAARLALATVRNPEPERGMASSVAIGFAYAQQNFVEHRSALLWPVDHGRVQVSTVQAIVARATAKNVVIPVFGNRGGHPTGLGRDLWQDLGSCVSAPQGARSVIRKLAASHPERVVRLEVEDIGAVRDLDTPEDLPASPDRAL